MKIQFGKYKGSELSEIPLSYLIFLLEGFEQEPDLKEAIYEQIITRIDADFKIDNHAIKKVYKEMAMKYHPDTGGSNGQMTAINDFYERLISEAK